MKVHALRLREDQDLRKGIAKYCDENNIQAACIVSVVGCLKEVVIRVADGISVFHDINSFEIVSMTGTIAKNGVHFHVALSGIDKKTIGGHVKEGCIVNTTAEIVLLEIDEYMLERVYDEKTGYDELVVTKH